MFTAKRLEHGMSTRAQRSLGRIGHVTDKLTTEARSASASGGGPSSGSRGLGETRGEKGPAPAGKSRVVQKHNIIMSANRISVDLPRDSQARSASAPPSREAAPPSPRTEREPRAPRRQSEGNLAPVAADSKSLHPSLALFFWNLALSAGMFNSGIVNELKHDNSRYNVLNDC
jgi:hypothetical protein